MTRVAFIGLGRMGHGMAGRYLEPALLYQSGIAAGRKRKI